MSTALDNTGHNCDLAVEAESLVMAKSHVITSYGTLRYTMKRTFSDGRNTITFTPHELLTRLVALIPPARSHQTRYHGLAGLARLGGVSSTDR